MANKYPLVYIEWCDAISNSDGWRTIEEALEWGEKADWIVRESGFVLKDTKEYILLAHKINEATENKEEFFGLLMKIPKAWIIKRVDLTESIK